MTKESFFQTYWPHALAATSGTGIFPEVAMAQAALESAWGESKLTKIANNFHGIKAVSGQPSVTMQTHEQTASGMVTVNAKFAKYLSPYAGFKAHVRFLQDNPRYASHGVFRATDPLTQVKAIRAAGYATDSYYVTKIWAIMQSLSPIQKPAIMAALAGIPFLGPLALTLTSFVHGISH